MVLYFIATMARINLVLDLSKQVSIVSCFFLSIAVFQCNRRTKSKPQPNIESLHNSSFNSHCLLYKVSPLLMKSSSHVQLKYCLSF